MASTIKDVAKHAGVSTATVSLVVHNNERISAQTRARVLKAISDLNYHPSRSARGLVSKQSGNIGFILRDDHFSRSEPFYTKVFLGTEFQAREDEYYILLTTVPSGYDTPDPLPRFVLERNVDGIIMAGAIPHPLIENLTRYSIPLVFVDYYPPGGDWHAVLIDNISGGLQATRHLIEAGHRRIAYLAGDRNHPSMKERLQGYRQAMEQAELPVDPALVVLEDGHSDRGAGYRAAARLLSATGDVTAIFAGNDAVAIGVLQYLKERGLRVPDDISLVGFDDVEADLMLDPPLTTIRVPKEELGIQALRLMVELIHTATTRPRKPLVPVELVVRASTRSITL